MSDEIYAMAASDLDHVLTAIMAARLAEAEPFDPGMVLDHMATAKEVLQTDTTVSAIAMRDVPDGLQGHYRACVGMAHDRAVALFQAALML